MESAGMMKMATEVRGGIDYGFTGEVKKIDVSRIRERLDRDSIVIVSNMGYSSVGEVLNCNTYEVAMACALTIEADKRICIVDGQISDEHGRGIHFMSAKEANMLIRACIVQSEISANHVKVVGEKILGALQVSPKVLVRLAYFEIRICQLSERNFFEITTFPNKDLLSRSDGYLSEFAAATHVCHMFLFLSFHGGVKRVHIIDGTVGGSLLLELFTIDNVETMIARRNPVNLQLLLYLKSVEDRVKETTYLGP
uniref:Amino-acid acetyltransferase n=1 Tax=Aegilops tauschii TaxID=37682 RepID=M8CGB9_AEGTA